MDNLKIDIYVGLLLGADDLPKLPRPKHIPPGVAWTTKESSQHYEQLNNLASTMTRKELKKAYQMYEEIKGD